MEYRLLTLQVHCKALWGACSSNEGAEATFLFQSFVPKSLHEDQVDGELSGLIYGGVGRQCRTFRMFRRQVRKGLSCILWSALLVSYVLRSTTGPAQEWQRPSRKYTESWEAAPRHASHLKHPFVLFNVCLSFIFIRGLLPADLRRCIPLQLLGQILDLATKHSLGLLRIRPDISGDIGGG